jgi:rod shape determining protein RodA
VTALYPADAADRARRIRSAVRLRHFADLDPVLTASTLVLSLLGVLLVYSATQQELAGGDPGSAAKRQALSVAIGVLLAYGVARAPFHLLRVAAPWMYVAATGLVLLTFTPLGSDIAGARAWLAVPGGMTVQPAEFLKIGLILVLAAVLASGPTGRLSASGVLVCLGAAGLPVLLVLLQNDTGTTLIMLAVALTMVIVGGAPVRWVLGLLGGLVASALLVVQLGLLQDYQVDRLTSFLDPSADGLGAGYNTAQARIAIGGGGWFGQGYLDGAQTQGGFVPVNDSDFIFTVAAEELGLLGALLLLGLLALVLWRALVIAREARSTFARMAAVGVAAWFAFQSFENIGMNLGITPVTGVTLPFVSSGGSSVMATWIAVGVLQVLHVRQRRGMLQRPEGRLGAAAG